MCKYIVLIYLIKKVLFDILKYSIRIRDLYKDITCTCKILSIIF